jgi:hypothetical protein
MVHKFVEHHRKSLIECDPEVLCLQSEQDALDLVAACGEHGAPRLLLHAGNLSPDFYRLSTRLAGDILLKFSNYHIKAAAVLTPELVGDSKFSEFVLETNRGSGFRVFYERQTALEWLVDG